MQIEVVPASDEDYRVVHNLARFYIYDMAEHAGFDFSADGDFDPENQFANYWGRPGSKRAWPVAWRGFPFLFRVDGKPAGFALVKRLSEAPPMFDMGEFFVARQYRRHGVGRDAAVQMFDRFAGHWEVREMLTNKAAQAFWRRVIDTYTRGAFTDAREIFADYNGEEFIVQRFTSGQNR